MSVDSNRRARQLSLPFKTQLLHRFMVPNRDEARKVERGLHELYRDRKITGEWFHDIDPNFFISDAEWLAMGMTIRAETDYLARTGIVRKKPGRPKKVPTEKPNRLPREYKDRVVLETLRSEGIEAAMNLRKEFSNA